MEISGEEVEKKAVPCTDDAIAPKAFATVFPTVEAILPREIDHRVVHATRTAGLEAMIALFQELAADVDDIEVEPWHYVDILDEEVAKHAVAKVGDVASKLTPAQRGQVFSRLVGMLEKSKPSVLNAAIKAIVTSLRKYPDTAGEVVPALQKLICENHADLTTVDARTSGH